MSGYPRKRSYSRMTWASQKTSGMSTTGVPSVKEITERKEHHLEARFDVYPGCDVTVDVHPSNGRFLLLATQGTVIRGPHDPAALARCWLKITDPVQSRVAREIALDLISPKPGDEEVLQRLAELEGMLSYLTRTAIREEADEEEPLDSDKEPQIKNLKLRDLLSRLGYKRQVVDYRNCVTPHMFTADATILCQVHADDAVSFEPFELRLMLSGIQNEDAL